MKNSKAVLSVKFKSEYGSEELLNRFQSDLELFARVPGLLQKYYIAEEATGSKGGIYIFESKNAMNAFLNSDLAKSIPAMYGVDLDTLRVENLGIEIEIDNAILA